MAAPNKNPQQRRGAYPVSFRIIGGATATAYKVFKARKKCEIVGVDLIPEVTLAADPTNYCGGAIKNVTATLVPVTALVNTNSVGGAALTANTIYNGTNGTKAQRAFAVGDVAIFDFTKAGTGTLPACTLVLWVSDLN